MPYSLFFSQWYLVQNRALKVIWLSCKQGYGVLRKVAVIIHFPRVPELSTAINACEEPRPKRIITHSESIRLRGERTFVLFPIMQHATLKNEECCLRHKSFVLNAILVSKERKNIFFSLFSCYWYIHGCMRDLRSKTRFFLNVYGAYQCPEKPVTD